MVHRLLQSTVFTLKSFATTDVSQVNIPLHKRLILWVQSSGFPPHTHHSFISQRDGQSTDLTEFGSLQLELRRCSAEFKLSTCASTESAFTIRRTEQRNVQAVHSILGALLLQHLQQQLSSRTHRGRHHATRFEYAKITKSSATDKRQETTDDLHRKRAIDAHGYYHQTNSGSKTPAPDNSGPGDGQDESTSRCPKAEPSHRGDQD
jgi:hypothetical protein